MTFKTAIAIDIGSTTAIAVLNDGELFFETHDLKRPNPSRPARFLKLVNVLANIQGRHAIECIFIEKPNTRGRDATFTLIGLYTMAQTWAHSLDIPFFDAEASAIKKFATGSGLAKKQQMIAAAEARGWGVTNEHEADAAHLLAWGLANVQVEA